MTAQSASAKNFLDAKKHILIPAICGLFALLVFLPALTAEFVWDDSIIQTMQLPYVKTVSDAFKPPTGMPEFTGAYYRPMVFLSYMADRAINRAILSADLPRGPHDPARAKVPHATTLILHIAATIAVTLLTRRILKNRQGADIGTLGAGLLFAVHPVHAETAVSMTGRSDSMAVFFLLSGILLSIAADDKKKHYILPFAFIAYLLAYLSKEVALAGILLLPLTIYATTATQPGTKPAKSTKKDLTRWLAALSAPALAAIAYIALRLTLNLKDHAKPLTATGSAIGNLLRAGGFYAYNTLIPWPLTPYIPELPGILPTAISLAIALTVALGAAIAYARGEKIYLTALAWYLIALSPSLYVAVSRVADSMVAQRYLYLPTVGVSLALGIGLAKLTTTRHKNTAITITGAILLAYSGLSLAGSGIWHSDKVLWTTLTKEETTAKYALPWVNLGNAWLDEENIDEAEKAYWQVLKPDTKGNAVDKALAYNGIGGVWYTRGMRELMKNGHQAALNHFAQAAKFYEYGINAGTNDYSIHNNLARANIQRAWLTKILTGIYDTGLLEAARRNAARSLMLRPGNDDGMSLMKDFQSHIAAAQGR